MASDFQSFVEEIGAQLADHAYRSDVEAEILDHLEQAAAELEAAGLSPEEACRRAMAEFGDPSGIGRMLGDTRRGARVVYRMLRVLGVVGAVILVDVATLFALLPYAMRYANEAVEPVMLLISGLIGGICAGWISLVGNAKSAPRFPAIIGATVGASLLLSFLALKLQPRGLAAGYALLLLHILVVTIVVLTLRTPERHIRRDLVISMLVIVVALVAPRAIPSVDGFYSSHGTYNPVYRRAVEGGRAAVLDYLQAAADGRQDKPLSTLDGKGRVSPESLRGASFTCPQIRIINPPPPARIQVHCDVTIPSGRPPIPALMVVAQQTDSGWEVLGVP